MTLPSVVLDGPKFQAAFNALLDEISDAPTFSLQDFFNVRLKLYLKKAIAASGDASVFQLKRLLEMLDKLSNERNEE
ncbi:hypothetical protein HDU91_000732 [Kappamyces sp. JEL0680]|nr:hypothetical protein HDU91_000732 [Kappamyces sp. JEL0680]